MFEKEHELLRWVASQLPNLPHIQEQLRALADKLEPQEKPVEDEKPSKEEKPAEEKAEIK